MTFKVWYRISGDLEVDVFSEKQDALRRSAAIICDRIGSELEFAGLENPDGHVETRQDLDQYVRAFRSRGLNSDPGVCPKYYVEVQSPLAVRQRNGDLWIKYGIEPTRVRASLKANDAIEAFGAERVRVTAVSTLTSEESVV
jgi:hypothetical protein